MIYVRKGYNDMSMIDWAKHEVELACKGDPNDYESCMHKPVFSPH